MKPGDLVCTHPGVEAWEWWETKDYRPKLCLVLQVYSEPTYYKVLVISDAYFGIADVGATDVWKVR